VYGVFQTISITLFLQLQLAATAVSLFCVFALCHRKKLLLSVKEEQRAVALVKQVLPFLLILLLMATHYRLDGFLLERLHRDGANQAGIYAAAYRLLDAGNMIGYLCASFLVPFIARHRRHKQTIQNVVLFIRHGLMVTAIIAVAVATAFAAQLQQILYHTNIGLNNQVMILCMAVLPAYYLVQVYGSVLTAMGQLKIFISVLAFSAGTNAVVNFSLIPSYGAVGCCVAALVSQYGCAVALCFFTTRRLGLHIASKSFLVYTIIGVICFGLNWVLDTLDTAVWVILAALCLVIVLLLVTQKATVKRLVSIFKS
jgi:O-antigen/teichoic acid export membrane protein